MSEFKKMIQRLTDAVNENEGANTVSVEQVEHYIGSDMSIATLTEWCLDCENNTSDCVNSDDIISLCEGFDIPAPIKAT